MSDRRAAVVAPDGFVDPVGHPFCLSTWDGRQLAERI
jgi:hypothetical protein